MYGAVNAVKCHRELSLKESTEEISRIKQEGTAGTTIVGDLNQDIDSPVIEKFARENGLCKTHQEVNDFDRIERDKTYVKG